MNINITIREQSCRGCELCADVCPTKVLVLDAPTRKMQAKYPVDCIGCLSCVYVCPSASLAHEGVVMVRNFARDLRVADLLRRHL